MSLCSKPFLASEISNRSIDRSIRTKLEQTVHSLKGVFFHDDLYVDAAVACLASKASLLLLGEYGTGKTHLMESLLKLVDNKIQAVQQGYLNAEIDEVFCRLSIPDLFCRQSGGDSEKAKSGSEVVIWRPLTLANVKAIDEIQRLGQNALSACFRMLSSGTIQYLGQVSGAKGMFWVIATANPWESLNDTLCVQLPPPLLDRFDAVMWVPSAGCSNLLLIGDNIEKDSLLDSLPVLWSYDDLTRLWRLCSRVELSPDINLYITLVNRILGFCQWGQGFDASSIESSKKKILCGKCNSSYICSRIARSPSIRAKRSLVRLAKGFCFLRGANRVEVSDVERAFPLVYWTRLTFFAEDEIHDRLKKLRELYLAVHTEIMESKEVFTLIDYLSKNRFDEKRYARLLDFKDSKVWVREVSAILDDQYTRQANILRERRLAALRQKDFVACARISLYAHSKLPPAIANEFHYDGEILIDLLRRNLQRLEVAFPHLYKEAERAWRNGTERFVLKPPDSTRWVLMDVTCESTGTLEVSDEMEGC